MNHTEYPDVNKVLDELLSGIKYILKDKLVGVYLYGSLVWGDFDMNVSDIDVLVAVSADINEEEFRFLKEMHETLVAKYREWDNRIEAQYLSLEALKTFKIKESKVATISPGDPFQFQNVGKHWLMNWYMVREKGQIIYGPGPKEIIEPISKEEFIEVVKEHVHSWDEWVKGMTSRKGQAYAILTLCRALYAAENGEQTSKKQAGLWVQKKLPHWSRLIQNALVWREEKTDVKEDKDNYLKTIEFVSEVRKLILSN